MRKYILDLSTGEPREVQNVLEWAEQFEQRCQGVQEGKPDIYKVAHTDFPGGIFVSTVFLGLDHNWLEQGKPILWETMVFNGELDGEMKRYDSKELALVGHKILVQKVKESLQ